MIIKHALQFETVIDETSEAYFTIQKMPKEFIDSMFTSMLKELVAPRLEPILDELNENGSYAILRLAK
jgi:hypothetical protein